MFDDMFDDLYSQRKNIGSWMAVDPAISDGWPSFINETPRIAEMETKRYDKIYSVHVWNTLRDIRAVQAWAKMENQRKTNYIQASVHLSAKSQQDSYIASALSLIKHQLASTQIQC